MNILTGTQTYAIFNIIFSLDLVGFYRSFFIFFLFACENTKRYLTERFSSKDNNMSHYIVRAWHAQHSIHTIQQPTTKQHHFQMFK